MKPTELKREKASSIGASGKKRHSDGETPPAQEQTTAAVSGQATPSVLQEAVAPAETTPPSAQITLTQSELDELRQKALQADQNWDRFLRAAAELDNYRKRAVREKEEVAKLTKEQLLVRLLPVMDALDSGLAAIANGAPSDSIVEGIKLVRSMLQNAFQEYGVEEIAAVGEKFNPAVHRAVSQEPSEQFPQDVIIRQTRKGYRVGDRILRAAEVVVSSGAAAKRQIDQ